MKIKWEERAWEEYLEWENEDKKTSKRINNLIKDKLDTRVYSIVFSCL